MLRPEINCEEMDAGADNEVRPLLATTSDGHSMSAWVEGNKHFLGEDDDSVTAPGGARPHYDGQDDGVTCEPLIRTIAAQQHSYQRRENDAVTIAGSLTASGWEGMEEDAESNGSQQSRSRIEEDSAPPLPAVAADIRASGSGGSPGNSSFGELDYEQARDESRLQLALALRLAAEASLLDEASEWRRGGSRGEEDGLQGRRQSAGSLAATRGSEGRYAAAGKGGRRVVDERVQEEDERRPGKKLQPWEREQCIFRFWVSDC